MKKGLNKSSSPAFSDPVRNGFIIVSESSKLLQAQLHHNFEQKNHLFNIISASKVH